MFHLIARSYASRGPWIAFWLCCVFTVTTRTADGGAPQDEPAVLTLTEAADLLRIAADELERLAERNALPARRVGSVWRFNRASLMAWLNGDWSQPADPSSGKRALSSSDMEALAARGTAALQDPPAPAAPQPAGQSTPIGEAPDERDAEEIVLRGQRVLLGTGDVVVDVGGFFSRSDDLLLASVDDRVGLATLEQSTLSTLLVGRVGIFRETELFASASFHHQDNHAFLGGINLARSNRSRPGDVGLGVRRTFLRESSGRPDIIGTFSAQIPTRDGSYALGGGLVLVKSFDPAVVFANASFTHSFNRVSSEAGEIRPEDRYDLSLGYSLGVNDTLAISTAVSGSFNSKAIFEDATTRRIDFFSLRFAVTSALTEGLYIEPSVSFGLTGPGDSFAFGLTIPYSF